MEIKSNYGPELSLVDNGYIYTGKYELIDIEKKDLNYIDKYNIQKLLDKTDTQFDDFIPDRQLKQIVHTFINTETKQTKDVIGGYLIGNVNIDNKSLILNGAIIKDSDITDSIISGITIIYKSKIFNSVITNINSDKLNPFHYTKIINSVVIDSILKGKHFYITTSTLYCAKIKQFIHESNLSDYRFNIKSSTVNFSGISLILKNFFDISFSNITFSNVIDLRYNIEYGITLSAVINLINIKTKILPIDFFTLNLKDTILTEIKINGNLYNKIQIDCCDENNFSFLTYNYYQSSTGKIIPITIIVENNLSGSNPILFTSITKFKNYLSNKKEITQQESEYFLSQIKVKEINI